MAEYTGVVGGVQQRALRLSSDFRRVSHSV